MLLEDAPSGCREHWCFVQPTLEEIITSEVLTRVWTAVAFAHDRHHGTQEVEPVTRSVLVGHHEARNRALTLIVSGRGIGTAEAAHLNRLRRRVERWTDLLLGRFLLEHDATELTFNRQRARDFAEDLRQERVSDSGTCVWSMLLSSLRTTYQKGDWSQAANPDLNRQIASAVFGCFEPDVSDSTGLLESLWETRLTNVTTDAQGMLEELLAIDWPTSRPTPGVFHHDMISDQ